MELKQCPLCGSKTIQKKRGHYEFDLKGKFVITPIVQYWACPNCKEVFFDREANRRIDEVLLKNRKRKEQKKRHSV